jgi:hypothetical protein
MIDKNTMRCREIRVRHISSDWVTGAKRAGGGIGRSKQSGMMSLVIFEAGRGLCWAAGLANGRWMGNHERVGGFRGKVWDDG